LFQTEIRQKQQTLEVCFEGFSVPVYLDTKSKSLIEEAHPKRQKKEKKTKDNSDNFTVSKDILHPELYEQLRAWRREQAQEQNVPAYVVLSQMALLGVTNLLPQDSAQLLRVPGIGKTTATRHGEAILQIVQQSIRQYGYGLN